MFAGAKVVIFADIGKFLNKKNAGDLHFSLNTKR